MTISVGDLRLGRLRDRITIEQPTRTQHAQTGEPVITWSSVAADVPALIEANQSEGESAEKNSRTTQLTIAIRYRSEWANQTTWRVIVDSEPYELTSIIDPDRRRRWLFLNAVSVS